MQIILSYRYAEWENRISNLSRKKNENAWLSFMFALFEYLFPNSPLDALLKNFLQVLDRLRAKLFQQNDEEGVLSISEITPDLIYSRLSREDIHTGATAVENLCRFLERQHFHGESLTISNWITCGLLKDIHLAEHCILLGSKQLAFICESICDKLYIRNENIPFRFSPAFVLIYLASQSVSDSICDEKLILNVKSEEQPVHRPHRLRFFSAVSLVLEDLFAHVNCGDALLFGALLDRTLEPVIYCEHYNDQQLRNEAYQHWNMALKDHFQTKKSVEQEVAIHYNSDFRKIITENVSRGEDFHFLCALVICLPTCQLLHNNRKNLTKPTLQKSLPSLYSPTMIDNFLNVKQPHPVLLNSHGITSVKEQYFPLLIESKTNEASLISMNDEVVKRAMQDIESAPMTLESLVEMLVERLSSVSFSISDKIELMFFVLRYGFQAPTTPYGLLIIEKCTLHVQSLLKMVLEKVQAKTNSHVFPTY